MLSRCGHSSAFRFEPLIVTHTHLSKSVTISVHQWLRNSSSRSVGAEPRGAVSTASGLQPTLAENARSGFSSYPVGSFEAARGKTRRLVRLVIAMGAGKFRVMSGANPKSTTAAVLPADEIFRRHADLLMEIARKYIWWMPAEEALEYPARVVAQVMNMGVFRDASRVAETLGDDCLRHVLQTAEAGWFNARSWHYWHYRLALAAVDEVPPLPVRRIA